jgi:cysteine desulfurase
LYGNPHSRTHAYGWETDKAVEQAREHVAKLIGADPKEIIFTSGATESNNMSIKGVARFFKRSGKKRHLITCQTEHKCVLDSCRHLQDEGFDVTYLPVGSNGLIDMAELEAAIRPDTALVSIMTVNNEIGVIQPIEEIGKLCRSRKVFFHTDGAQAVGKIPLDVNKMNIDLMSISGHKIYGPKGVGACYVRRRPRVRLDPLISGGGQERGLRSGTIAPPLVIGFGEAARIAKEEMEVSLSHCSMQIAHRFLMITYALNMHDFLSCPTMPTGASHLYVASLCCYTAGVTKMRYRTVTVSQTRFWVTANGAAVRRQVHQVAFRPLDQRLDVA